MSFPFVTTIPAAQNSPSLDQPNMQVNNASTSQLLAVNHVSFNDAQGGLHKLVTFNANQGSDPGVGLGVSNLYTKLSNSLSQLFFQNSSTIYQLTGAPNNSGTNWSYATPFGFKVAWGTVSGSSPITVTIAGGLAFGSTNYSAMATYADSVNARVFGVTILSTTQFQITFSGGATPPFNYFAIGV